jgi:ribosomal protein S18 acetylase RimI-like enzyme
MIKIIKIHPKEHLSEVKNFFELKAGSSVNNFTYFKKRNFECIEKHLATFLLYFNDELAGYSHLDKDSEKVWFGICIGENYIGKKLGDKLLEETLNTAKNYGINEIFLSVYKSNIPAINLYKKKNFVVFQENENSFFMKRKI